MTSAAKAASEAFYKVLRAKGRRVDQALLEEAWEAAATAAKRLPIVETRKPDVKIDDLG
jgi:hypothetical protein